MEKTHLTKAIHQSSICFCPVVRSEGIPGMWSVVLRSAGSSHLFSLTQQHNAVDSPNDPTWLFWDVKPNGDIESQRHSPLINRGEARWDQTACTTPMTAGRGKKYSSWGNFYWLLRKVCCLWSCFSFRIFNKVISDDNQTHTYLGPAIS